MCLRLQVTGSQAPGPPGSLLVTWATLHPPPSARAPGLHGTPRKHAWEELRRVDNNWHQGRNVPLNSAQLPSKSALGMHCTVANRFNIGDMLIIQPQSPYGVARTQRQASLIKHAQTPVPASRPGSTDSPSPCHASQPVSTFPKVPGSTL